MKKTIKYFSQEKARFIFEELTGLKFQLTRKELNGRLELDGYCKELKIAFEYNGEQHYDPQHYYNVLQSKNNYDSQIVRDHKKRTLCKKNGIILIEIRHTKDTNCLEKIIRSELLNLGVNVNNKKIAWSRFKERTDDLKKIITILETKDIILLTKAYLGSHSHHKFQCTKCDNVWESVLKDVLYKSGCSVCSGNAKHSFKDIQKMARDSGVVLLSNVYTNMLTKHKFKCQKCKYIWDTKPNQIQQGRGCPKCSGNLKITSEQFYTCIEAKKIKLLDKFNGITKKYRFCCETCQYIWSTTAANIWFKTGCYSCSITKKRINIDDLKRLASKRDLTLLSNQCLGYNTKHLWKCNICGKEYQLKPCNVQRGTSCRRCKLKEKEVDKECL